MSEPTLVALDYARIDINPYQVKGDRRFRGPDFDELVESVRANGVRQPPPARPHPTLEGVVQLQSGHRRLAASKIARPGEPFSVVLKDVSEIEMFEGCAEENLQREGINDIERAQLMETYKTIRPDATNADIARVFRLKDPASVTNIRKLLRLPAVLQAHVAENNLPDAYARQLVGIAAVNEKTAIAIGNKVAAASKSEKRHVFDQATANLFWKQMTTLDAGWSDDWLADNPVTVETDLGDGDRIVGPCAGCVFHVQTQCARPTCFNEKLKMWTGLELERVSAKLKIAGAAAAEQTAVLFRGEYNDDEFAKLLLNNAPKEIRALLRLVPYAGGDRYNHLQHLLGSRQLTLAATDKATVDTWIGAQRNKRTGGGERKLAKTEKPAAETDTQRAKRVAAEKEEQTANRAARSAQWKSKYDALWLVEQAARLAGPQLQIEGDFLKSVEALFAKKYHLNGDVEATAWLPLFAALKEAATPAQSDALRRQHIALCVFGDCGVADSNGRPDYERAHEHIVKEAGFHLPDKGRFGLDRVAHGLGITLPDGWDIPPVHRTEINCWQCGTFAGNVSEKLTGRDLAEGWIDDGIDGVFCSVQHKKDYLDAQIKVASNPAAKKKLAQTRHTAKAQTKKAKRRK